MAVLVTGGAGYIGSHVITALAASGRQCISIDNYSNSSTRAAMRLKALVPSTIALAVDIRDTATVKRVLEHHAVDSVIHMAGLKAVGESIEKPDLYFDNNVRGTLSLLEALRESPVRKFVFSSSATVYGPTDRMPVDETAPTGPTNPYGANKLMIEQILRDEAATDSSWKVANLRYFNPVGAHESGRIGEDPNGIPNNLMPFVCQVAAGRREELQIFGNDYSTVDGTGVRDFIHVCDLAEGHLAALDVLDRAPEGTNLTINLGTGRGYSVLELVKAFERVNGVSIPHQFVERRAGDLAAVYADASLAKKVLGWEAKRGLDEMCRDAWRWQQQNPNGYRS